MLIYLIGCLLCLGLAGFIIKKDLDNGNDFTIKDIVAFIFLFLSSYVGFLLLVCINGDDYVILKGKRK